MKVTIYRSSPEIHFEDFYVPFKPEEGYTIMQVLVYIQETLDPSLAFFTHSACSHGICGRCLLNVNGKPVLACVALADRDSVRLEPKNDKPTKDLLCL
jgi:succinate dehydrogenase/fumarate reductase-like Fe-S protein